MPQRVSMKVVVGARPNFVKVAPLWRALRHGSDWDLELIHTGQHYDYTMSQVFFEQLDIPRPQVFLDVGSGSHAQQTARVLQHMEDLLVERHTDLLVVIGDVNSTVAAALAAAKLHIPVAHVEAGLRSFDKSMPEEINRILTDRMSALLFVTEPAGVENLEREGYGAEGVHLVGNIMIDALSEQISRIRASAVHRDLELPSRGYGVLTAHRPVNVDTAPGLQRILEVLRLISADMPVVFPVHPRTRAGIDCCGLGSAFSELNRVRMIQPLGYVDFMGLVDHARCVLTDSGGLQAESTWLGVPCLTLRDTTEHLLTVQQGSNRLTGLDLQQVRQAWTWALGFDRANYRPPALWDGHTAARICNILNHWLQDRGTPS